MRSQLLLSLAAMLSIAGVLQAQTTSESTDTPRPIPLTRPEMKERLEEVKQRSPRIPLPELTAADREQLRDAADSYESRLRYHYLDGGSSGWRGRSRGRGRANPSVGPGTRDEDPPQPLDYGFKVELFWLVSRINNCHYCLGHQETKLLGAGRSEQRIAALDGDWSVFAPAEQAAYAFAKKFTLEPHQLRDEDIDSLRDHYTDLQILEMILSMSWNNSINRWKEGAGVPQRADEGGYSRLVRSRAVDADSDPALESLPHGSYLTATPDAYKRHVTRVAPVHFDPDSGKPTTATIARRPPHVPYSKVEHHLQICRQRSSRLPLLDEATARQRLSLEPQEDQPVWNWMRLLAQSPHEGVSRARGVLELENNRDLTPLLKAQLSWIVARGDRSWYAIGHAQRRLQELGQSDEQIAALDGDWSDASPRDRTLYRVAKNLAASPVVLTDDDVARAVDAAGPAAVTQAVRYVGHLAAFNRVTEAAGLTLEW